MYYRFRSGWTAPDIDIDRKDLVYAFVDIVRADERSSTQSTRPNCDNILRLRHLPVYAEESTSGLSRHRSCDGEYVCVSGASLDKDAEPLKVELRCSRCHKLYITAVA